MCGTVREVGLEKLGEEMALELSLGGKREQRGGRPLKWGHGLNKDQIQVGGGRAQGWEKGQALALPGAEASSPNVNARMLREPSDFQNGQGADGGACGRSGPVDRGRGQPAPTLSTSSASKPKLHSTFWQALNALSAVSIIAFQESPVFRSIFAKM